jgi:hypothetical protein
MSLLSVGVSIGSGYALLALVCMKLQAGLPSMNADLYNYF